MWPLTDITIYSEWVKEPSAEFGLEKNFVCDIYHNRLNRYKPPKTARICLDLREKKSPSQPFYFGAICHYGIEFDIDKYRTLTNKLDRYRFILDMVHTTILELADILSWDKSPFETSYQSILADNFKFSRVYPRRMSRDRKTAAQVILEKTETKTILRLRIDNGQPFEIEFVEKRNSFWFDPGYKLAERMKWIDRDKFGYRSKAGNKEIYYSISDKRVVSNLKFEDVDI